MGETESLQELARMLGGDFVSEKALLNAAEMKEQARMAKIQD